MDETPQPPQSIAALLNIAIFLDEPASLSRIFWSFMLVSLRPSFPYPFISFTFSLVLFLFSFPVVSIMPTAKLTVNVLDVNDNTPRFRPFGVTYFTERILEGATQGTTLISISAVDPDKGANGQITYELLNLSPEGYACLEDQSAGQ